MNWAEFLEAVINKGIEAAKRDYKGGKKLEGAIAGFEACRGKTPLQLMDHLRVVNDFSWIAEAKDSDEIRYRQCYRGEVEWVANCASVVLPTPLAGYLPTARAAMTVAEIVGVDKKLTH